MSDSDVYLDMARVFTGEQEAGRGAGTNASLVGALLDAGRGREAVHELAYWLQAALG